MSRLFKSTPEVLVVGAGPVGLYTALDLTFRNVGVGIVEKEARGTSRSYALALHPRSLELLSQLGLADPVLERARKVRTVGFYEGEHRHAELDLGKLFSSFPFVAVLPQSEFEDLLERALSDAGVRVLYEHRLAKVEPGPDAVNVTVDALGADSVGYAVGGSAQIVERSHELSVGLLLAADGHDSLARRRAHISFDEVRPTEHYAVFEFTASGELPDEICVVLQGDTKNVLWPISEQRYRFSFMLDDVPTRADSRTKDRLPMGEDDNPFPHFGPSLLDALIYERAPWFQGRIDQVHWHAQVQFDHRLASSFCDGRIWLAGDAAHMAGPVGVHSMNLGLSEADALCNIYADGARGGHPERALATFNDERRAQWQTLLQPTDSLVASADALPWVRQHKDQLLSTVPASGSQLVALLAQLGLSLAS
jgi:2-polyprenyl-6-methoxyphenol hydroxylase-like FAD-dependent oxidoreductase